MGVWMDVDRMRNEDVRAAMKSPDPAEDEEAAPEVIWTQP